MAEPWSADKLAGIVSAACLEHFWNKTSSSVTFCSGGQGEKYEVLDTATDDQHELLFRRVSDGKVFEIDIWAAAREVPSG